jgi:hypothetical protein
LRLFFKTTDTTYKDCQLFWLVYKPRIISTTLYFLRKLLIGPMN